MTFSIAPNLGIGPLQFGMPRGKVHTILQAPYKSFPSKSLSSIPMDAFFENSLQIFYKDPGVCEAVECYSPVFKVLFMEHSILGTSYATVRDILLQIDGNIKEDDFGLISYSLGVGLFAPSHTSDKSANTESVIVFEQGYYERYGLRKYA
jgi:hypothetical protein